MIPAATEPRSDPINERLLWIDPNSHLIGDRRVFDLLHLLSPGDLIVVNDAATIPASIAAIGPRGEAMELRLLGARRDGRWQAALFGGGDWRTPTERRPEPPALSVGDQITALGGARITIAGRSPLCDRLVELRFDLDADRLWPALYSHGRPVQYSYLRRDLDLRSVQTPFGGRPWSVEMPSAGRPLVSSLLLSLRRAGVRVAALTHAAGLSSIGDEEIDRILPLPERFEIPERTVRAIHEARRAGGRIIAAGTTVVRAIEGAIASKGELLPGEGETDLVIRSGHVLCGVDGILSGVHEPGSSHFSMLSAFAPRALLESAHAHAAGAGYLAHEFGDHTLILPGISARARIAA